MFCADIDLPKSVLRISFSGTVPAEEVRRCSEKVKSLVNALTQGFRLLTDLTALESMDLESVPYVEQIMDLCNERGVETVVRIIPDPHKDIGLNIMSLFHYRRRVRFVTCDSLAEAERILATA